MTDRTTADLYLAKAEESLAGAESEYANSRYNNCANRAYYACFQAAIAALVRASIRPPSARGQWGHDSVQARFAGSLINQRKLYPSDLRDALERLFGLRQAADYEPAGVSQTQAFRALQRSQSFVRAIQQRGGSSR